MNLDKGLSARLGTSCLTLILAFLFAGVTAQASAASLTGNWPTFGNGPAHTGYFPGRLGNGLFTNRWAAALPGPLQQVAIGNKRVYVASYQYNNNRNGYLAALDEASGQIVWQFLFASADWINPPTYDSGSVYVQRSHHGSDSQLWSFDSWSGGVNWQAPFSTEGARYLAPCVADGKVWVNGGSYGGLYGFNQTNGSQLFFTDLEQSAKWTPAYSDGRLYSWGGRIFREHNPLTGAVLWTTNLAWDWNGYDLDSTVAVDDGMAYCMGSDTLFALNLSTRRVAWRKPGGFYGTPAVAAGIVYGISNNTVVAFAKTGAKVATYFADSTLYGQPIITDDALIVGSSSTTYVFNLKTRSLRQRLEVGGFLTLANNVLYVAAASGQLFAFTCAKDVQFVVAGTPWNCGLPYPCYGTNFYSPNWVITNQVSRVVETNMGRFQCMGWTGTGSVPFVGTDCVAVVTIKTNSTLTWNWLPLDYQLNCSVAGPGSVAVATNGWYAVGSTTTITATPQAGCRFVRWVGDVPADLATNSTISLTMNQGRRIVAVFGTTGTGPLTGDWPTFGNGPSHTAYFSGMLGTNRFSSWWTATFSESLYQVTVGGGRVYVIPSPYHQGTVLTALDEFSGQLVWRHSISNCYSVNPPTYDSGSVYVQLGEARGSQLWSFNASSASVNWQAPFSAQWDHCMAPTVADGKIWVEGGTYGGLYEFSQNDGSQLFFEALEQCDGWTPTYSEGRLFTWVDRTFREHDLLTGSTVWSTTLGGEGSTYSMDRTIAVAQGAAYFVGNPNLYAMDLSKRRLSWAAYGAFSGTPAVANGVVYAISNNTVLSYAADGTRLGPFVADSRLMNQPIITDDALIVGSDSKTYVFGLFDHVLLQTLNVGGKLSLANDTLYVATGSGQLCTFTTGRQIQFLIEGNPMEYGYPVRQTYGTSLYSHACTVTNMVASPVETNMGRFRCVGWTGTGSVPASGTASTVVFDLQTDSTLTWNWEPVDYQLICEASGPGRVVASNGWYAADSTTTVSAIPNEGCRFVKWIGDVPVIPAGATTTIPMNRGRHLCALFAVTAPGPLVGDWPTFGNGPAHTGYFPGALGNLTFTNRWAVGISGAQQQVAVFDGIVFVNLGALSSGSGQVIWKLPLTRASSIHPPTYDSGSVYVQVGIGSDSQLWSVDAYSGAVNWQTPSSAQLDSYMAPCIANGKVWVNCGSYGGLYGFDQLTGSQLFFNSRMEQFNGWAPTCCDGRLFSLVDGAFWEHNPVSDGTLWSTNLGWNGSGPTMNGIIAAADGYAFFIGNPDLYAMDLSIHRPAWRYPGAFSGTPAVANGIVYAIFNNTVIAFTSGGICLGTYRAATPLKNQPIVTDDSLIVASESATYIFNLSDFTLRQTLNAGGALSLANGVLYIASQPTAGFGGQLTAYSTAPDWRLVIAGDPLSYGHPSPRPYGTNSVLAAVTLTNRVPSLVETNMGRFQCVGWTGTGCVPASGTDCVVVVSMLTNSTLTWQWTPTEYQLICQTAGRGKVNFSNLWCAAGSSIAVTATPQDGYQFVKWIGNISPEDSVKPTVSFVMNRGRSITALFGMIAPGSTSQDWTTYGGGTSHSGYVPGLVNGVAFGLRWTADLGGTLGQAVIASNRVYVTRFSFLEAASVVSLHGYSGQVLWKRSFNSSSALNPPTYDSGSVYVERTSDQDGLWSLNAATGSINWESHVQAQHNGCLAPIVADGKVWAAGGLYGGMYCFDTDGGSQIFFSNLEQYDRWTPAFSDGRLFTWVNGMFREHDPETGTVQWYEDTGTSWWFYEMDRTIAIADGHAYCIGNPDLYAMDLTAHTQAWSADGAFLGTPAAANGKVYAISNSSVVVFGPDGTKLGRYVASTPLMNQPIVMDDTVIAASSSETYIFNLFDFSLRQTIPVGGSLSLANGVLYITSDSGKLYAYSLGPDVQLVVNNGQGGSLWPIIAGTNMIGFGTRVSLGVASPVALEQGVREAAIGWTGTGSVPSSGTGSLAEFTITNDSTITWNWQKQFYLNGAGDASSGSVNITNAWYDDGSQVTLVATPAAYFHFSHWEGGLTNTNASLVITVDRPITARACFDADLVSHGVPKWWLAQYGIAITDAGTMGDLDHDGVLNWQEYRNGSNPLEPQRAPSFTAALTNQTVASGSSITFEPAFAGSSPLAFQWQFRGSDMDGQTNASLTLTNLQPTDSGEYALLIHNPAGRARASVQLMVTNLLGWALNATNLIWTTGGDLPWVAETDISYDGVASAQSGVIEPGQVSWIETTVKGPATIGYWCNVPSDGLGSDLNVFVGETRELGTFTYGQWQHYFVAVPRGVHQVRWSYEKSWASVWEGTAWLDAVSIASGVPQVPQIVGQPHNVIAPVGSKVTFNVKATGTLLSYQWSFQGVPMDGETNSHLTIPAANQSSAGYYSVDVYGAWGHIASAPALLGLRTPLASALEYAGAAWEDPGGDAPWFFQKTTTHDHADAAQSGKITDNQYSSMQNTVRGPGTISFWWKVSSEKGGDYLRFLVMDSDGQSVFHSEISGEVDWQQQSFYLPNAGEFTMNFSYTRDANVSHGADRGWVDGVQFVPDTAPVITKGPQSQTVCVGSIVTLSAAAKGSAPLSYTWYRDQEEVGYGEVLKLSEVSFENAGSYRVVVANNAGTCVSQPTFLTVTSAMLGQVAIQGSDVSFSFPALTGRPPRHQWYFNYEPLANSKRIHGATTSRLRVDMVTPDDAGYYGDSFGTGFLNVIPPSSVVSWGDVPTWGLQAPEGLSDVTSVATGDSHCLALKGDGTVVGWGASEYGQLDFPKNLDRIKAVAAGSYHSLFLREDGTVAACGFDTTGQIEVPEDLAGVVAISAGASHSLALKADGTTTVGFLSFLQK